ncbi:hypothetical protein [Nonomuraea longicatena]|uniref:Uncharacterized protein n=1 Tax=Nonomuraea longicatena TaxID=83682 RepID=A0ABN1QY90_9ACTN
MPAHLTLTTALDRTTAGADALAAFATAALTVTALAALLFGAVALYRWSLRRHPYTDCRMCKGTGRRRSRLFAHSVGHCPDCSGTGLKPRLGARLLNVR